MPGNLIPEGFGLAEYDPATGALVQDATVFARADFGGTAAEMSSWELGSPVISGRYLCAIIAHPEYSMRTQLVLSYFDPATAPHGHVMMALFAGGQRDTPQAASPSPTRGTSKFGPGPATRRT